MTPISGMKVKELKEALKARGLKTNGLKAELAHRLSESLAEDLDLTAKPAPLSEVPATTPSKQPVLHLQAAPFISPLDVVMKEMVLGRGVSKELAIRENGLKKQKT
jgi:hypothetical protein